MDGDLNEWKCPSCGKDALFERCECPEQNVKGPLNASTGPAYGGNSPLQQGFTTGATRSTAEGKIDYEGHISPRVLAIYGAYMSKHRLQRDGKMRASDNWQLGIPLARYVKSFIRHAQEFHQLWRGQQVINVDNDSLFDFRTLLCALRFNIDGMILEMDKAAILDHQSLHREDRILLEQEAGI